jgi:hypothetical protein
VQRFATAREAKEFLIGKIAEQAQLTGIPLSDIERKILYFTETDWTLPDIAEVNEAFERDYDRQQYEKKVVKIVRQLRARRDIRADDSDLWRAAVDKLRKGDHYLLVMLEEAGALGRPRGDLLKLLASGLAICAVLLAIAWFLAGR